MKHRNKRVEVGEVVPTVSAREFVRIWQTSASVAEIAKKIGRSKNACRVRAFRYREDFGVPLKHFPPVLIEEIDWGELAEFAESLEVRQAGSAAPVEAVG
jgi:hypothetical protein